jgi:glycolate oxidase iron-sulfur subunit
MQTSLDRSILPAEQLEIADAALRRCVHCGFCNATCPTYQLLGNELDGPRGRIYLIKQVLEGNEASARTQTHLDRCLTCRACETTCPSSVPYGRLLDIGRQTADKLIRRPRQQRLLRYLIRRTLPYPGRVRLALRLFPWFRWLLPTTLRTKFAELRQQPPGAGATPDNLPRRVLLLQGCVQDAVRPDINAATIRVLARLGISAEVIDGSGCCGALSHHLDAEDEARQFMRRNIDAWWPYIEQGYEAVVSTASACSLTLKDYGHLLAADPDYREKAATLAAMTMDLAELLAGEDLESLFDEAAPQNIAVHLPCTSQHGQDLSKALRKIAATNGNCLTTVKDAHLCCGAAGTYSLFQPELSTRLRRNRLQALEADEPDCIVTANIGCLLHLQPQASVPVRHWIEVLDDAGTPAGRYA